MRPYYTDGRITIFNADCREILPTLKGDAIVTDPPWPGCAIGERLAHGVDAAQLLGDALVTARDCGAKRLALQLGSQTDPRCLGVVPAFWPFFRAAFFYYAWPSYRGRVLGGTEIAYLFGNPPPSRPGRHLIPGMVQHDLEAVNGEGWSGGEISDMCRATRGVMRGHLYGSGDSHHPTPRSMEHARWLTKFWMAPRETLIDPFAGGGTILLAAREFGVKAIGIEVEERYCEIIVKRLHQKVMLFEETEKSPSTHTAPKAR